jgi:hypothetical protein
LGKCDTTVQLTVCEYPIDPPRRCRDPLPAFASTEVRTEPVPLSLAAFAARYRPRVANGPDDGPGEWEMRSWQKAKRMLVRINYRGPAPRP